MKLNAVTLITALVLSPTLSQADSNVAWNKSVTLDGTFFTYSPEGASAWGGGSPVSESTVVDDVFLPKSQRWDKGAVWWDAHQLATGGYPTTQSILIDLQGTFIINSFIVQADDNDQYLLYYRNGSSDPWSLAWTIPAVGGWGMQTRPDSYSNTTRFSLPSSITATELKLTGGDSDKYYSVSEIQAFGAPVPEPTTMLLFGTGLIGLAAISRKKDN